MTGDWWGKWFAVFERNSETRTRGSTTTPHLVPRPGTNRLITDWRPPNPVEHRLMLVIPVEHDSALHILLQVLSLDRGGGGRNSGGQQKRGRLTPPSKIVQRANSRSRTFPSIPLHSHPMFPIGNLPRCDSPCNLTLPPRASARAFCPRQANLRVVLTLAIGFPDCVALWRNSFHSSCFVSIFFIFYITPFSLSSVSSISSIYCGVNEGAMTPTFFSIDALRIPRHLRCI